MKLFAYHLAPINGRGGRFHLQPCSGVPIVEWNPLGSSGAGKSASLGPEPFSNTASGGPVEGVEEDPMESFNRANEAISTRKGTVAPIVSGDEVMIIGSSCKTVIKSEAVSSSPGRRSRGRMAARLTPQAFDAECATGGLSNVLEDLNTRVFSQENIPLPGEGPAEVILAHVSALLSWILLGDLSRRFSPYCIIWEFDCQRRMCPSSRRKPRSFPGSYLRRKAGGRSRGWNCMIYRPRSRRLKI
ncbi:unnamed protein product [Eruca vesicaria subsp. sativa]|uniref:Uncharacterized protein n=1 Tax=Eruca vesicaria subsp. sativa TaxID=29727 RepID=A0ABC8K0K6_ERUVS|nr:unnamed protein product [Eruca vesicaria subsp. sativa]